MLESSHPILDLIRKDKRYKFEAYAFVFDALAYAHDELGLGTDKPSDPAAGESEGEEEGAHRHLTGQQLCEAIRLLALDQFGYMAKCVLNSWGIYSTSDFGEIVFNLIRINQMKKTKEDRREDFDNVFDFDTDLQQQFKIKVPK